MLINFTHKVEEILTHQECGEKGGCDGQETIFKHFGLDGRMGG